MQTNCDACGAEIFINLATMKFGVPMQDWQKCPHYREGERFNCNTALKKGSLVLQEMLDRSKG